MQEPGLDRHEWESEWQALEEELSDDPAGTLSELDDLVGRMLESRGYALGDDVAAEGDDPEVVTEFRAAREITRRVDAGASVDPGDVASAVHGYRALYEHVLAERTAP
ncbi:MAG: hypothetical protein QOF50_521 [Gaiellaceae bacterium]|nr:hypothetical protein [Gaiellaceae bacterium]